ncbi:MAG: hypothetical protein HQK55_13250 [Deltaproteobacteria bacterium]|nr:hypothetical protein [Deltaproteobacteria bacterium]
MNLKNQPRTTLYVVKHMRWPIILAVLLSLYPVGCSENRNIVDSDEQLAAYLADKPDALKRFYARVLEEGSRNMVLNQMEAGLAAMELGEYRLAEESFDQTLLGIESVYANNEQAENARGLWRKEGSKDFKGEPYERVMAYYYRGLLYILRGDYENARACFKSGILQDAFAEEDQNKCDFALLIFLEGWSSQQLGATSLAKQSYDELKTLRPDFVLPGADDNCLMLIETGGSPIKVAMGKYDSILAITRAEGFRERWAKVILNNKVVPAFRMENIFWQAASRGGRLFDGILAGKAKFKDINDTMGNSILDICLKLLNEGNAEHDSAVIATAMLCTIVGLIPKIIAIKVETAADTRYWHNLPDSVHVVSTRMAGTPTVNSPGLKPGEVMQFSFYDENGGKMPELKQTAKVQPVPPGRSGLVWVRSRSAVN